jgi:hypothetical protein
MDPTRTKPSGSKKEDGSTGEIKPLKRRWKVERFSKKAQERRDGFERIDRSPVGRKALKGETQERRELKEAFTGMWNYKP